MPSLPRDNIWHAELRLPEDAGYGSVTRILDQGRVHLVAIVVVALGVMMALIGAFEMYYGNTYIQVERGWSAFIAGSVLLAGGVMTIALGLAIRAVTELTEAMTRQVAVPRGVDHIVPSDFSPDFALTTPANPPRLEPGSPALNAILAPQPVPEPPAHAVTSPTEPDRSLETTWQDFDAPTAPDLAAISHYDAGHSEPHEGEESYERYEDEALHATEHEEPGHAAHAEQEAAPVKTQAGGEDWLDKHFAELGHEFDLVPDTAPHEPEPATHPASAGVEHEAPSEDYPAAHDDGPHHEPELLGEAAAAHEDAAPPTAPTSAVIGRYDSEGTSYVMYADGSIEAQSDAGVYRFASMAELKAFIEG